MSTQVDFYDLREDDVILVTGVEYELVQNRDVVEFSKFNMDMANVYPIKGTDECVYTETKINLPIMEFGKREGGRNKRMYVAYSPEIEELLNKPYNIMYQDLENARDRINRQDLKLRSIGLPERE